MKERSGDGYKDKAAHGLPENNSIIHIYTSEIVF
jgi:hypothetical protein